MALPVLIDTDPGIDDALALIFALRSEELSVEAITTVAGNVPVELTTRNALRILTLLSIPGALPVARGAPAPLTRSLVSASHVHGDDGLGNIDRLRTPDGSPLYPEPTVELVPHDGAGLILETIRRWPDELTVIALGPLTNLAIALQRDPAIMRKVREVVIMGGAIAVPGNVSPVAEFNFYVDPEAAHRVLAAGLPIRLVPLDVTQQVILRRDRIERRMAGRRDPVSRFVWAMARAGLEFAQKAEGLDGLVLHDPLAVAVALDPSLMSARELFVDVETEGVLTRGMAVADRRFPSRAQTALNCQVAMTVAADRVLAKLLERLCPESA
ncbi:MAG TPA: nucleoside hydrolase [Methylomirabilota bacterium]|nr:nucleoside hydrolase [Methylomirabilota bacterium]